MAHALKSTVFAALAALSFAASPAQARDGHYRDGRGDDGAAVAIGAGILGLALGAAIASDRYDDDHYYYGNHAYPRRYYYRTYPAYHYDHHPRHYRDGWRRGGEWRGDRGWRGHRGGHGRGHRGWRD